MYCFRRRRSGLVWLLVAALAAPACFRAQARVPVELPPLEIPPPPPRLVDTSPVEDPPPGPVLAEPPSQPTPPVTLTAPARPAGQAGSQKTPPVAQTGNASPEARTPPTTLQNVRPQEEGRIERAIRALIARAAADLNRVDPQKLGREAKANYDQARRFVAQADEALKAKNLIFAETVADKAVTLAGQLAGR